MKKITSIVFLLSFALTIFANQAFCQAIFWGDNMTESVFDTKIATSYDQMKIGSKKWKEMISTYAKFTPIQGSINDTKNNGYQEYHILQFEIQITSPGSGFSKAQLNAIRASAVRILLQPRRDKDIKTKQTSFHADIKPLTFDFDHPNFGAIDGSGELEILDISVLNADIGAWFQTSRGDTLVLAGVVKLGSAGYLRNMDKLEDVGLLPEDIDPLYHGTLKEDKAKIRATIGANINFNLRNKLNLQANIETYTPGITYSQNYIGQTTEIEYVPIEDLTTEELELIEISNTKLPQLIPVERVIESERKAYVSTWGWRMGASLNLNLGELITKKLTGLDVFANFRFDHLEVRSEILRKEGDVNYFNERVTPRQDVINRNLLNIEVGIRFSPTELYQRARKRRRYKKLLQFEQ